MNKKHEAEIKRTVFFLCRQSFDEDGGFNIEEWDMPITECRQLLCDDICEVDDKKCDGCAFVLTEANKNQVQNAARRWRKKEERRAENKYTWM